MKRVEGMHCSALAHLIFNHMTECADSMSHSCGACAFIQAGLMLNVVATVSSVKIVAGSTHRFQPDSKQQIPGFIEGLSSLLICQPASKP